MSSTVILAYPPEFLVEALELLPRASGDTYFDYLQNWFRVGILALPVMHFFGALLIEVIIIDLMERRQFLEVQTFLSSLTSLKPISDCSAFLIY